MKINILPVPHIIIDKPNLPVRGRAKLFAMWLREGLDNRERTYRHELVHVYCFYFWWAVVAAVGYMLNQPLLIAASIATHTLLSFIPHYNLLEECAAHAVSAKHSKEPHQYIIAQAGYMPSKQSAYNKLHRFKPATFKKLMCFFYRIVR